MNCKKHNCDMEIKGPKRKSKEWWIHELNFKYNKKYNYSLFPDKINSIDKVQIICPNMVYSVWIWDKHSYK